MIAELVWDSKCGTGECPTWDAANRRLLFCDIPAGQIHAVSLTDGARRMWQLPDVVGSFGLCASGRLIVALRHTVVLYDLETETLTPLTRPIDEPITNRLNDGKVGPDGSFWVGSMDENSPRESIGALYRVTPDGRITRKAEGYAVSNGLAWSPDGTTMYHACTRAGVVDAWDYAEGELSNRRVFATLDDATGRPDGAATDSEGHYWSAGVTAGCLNRLAPDGSIAARIGLPTETPTMPCFTPGAIYVTSLRRKDAPADSTDGGLFRLATSVQGAAIPLFADR